VSTQDVPHIERPLLHVTWQVLLPVQVSVAFIVVLHVAHEPPQQMPLEPQGVPFVTAVATHIGPLAPVHDMAPVVQTLFVLQVAPIVHAVHVPLSQ
jgi:hypothetical protein